MTKKTESKSLEEEILLEGEEISSWIVNLDKRLADFLSITKGIIHLRQAHGTYEAMDSCREEEGGGGDVEGVGGLTPLHALERLIRMSGRWPGE